MTKKKKDNENEAHKNFKNKDKKEPNVASSVIIDDPSHVEDILCVTMVAYHVEVNDVYEDMHITKSDLTDALLTLNDALSQTCIMDSCASY